MNTNRFKIRHNLDQSRNSRVDIKHKTNQIKMTLKRLRTVEALRKTKKMNIKMKNYAKSKIESKKSCKRLQMQKNIKTKMRQSKLTTCNSFNRIKKIYIRSNFGKMKIKKTKMFKTSTNNNRKRKKNKMTNLKKENFINIYDTLKSLNKTTNLNIIK